VEAVSGCGGVCRCLILASAFYCTVCPFTQLPRVGPGCVLCTRIDPLRFLAGCHSRQLNQGLVVALSFLVVR